MLPYIKNDLFLRPMRFPCLGRIKKSRVFSHCGVQHTDLSEALIYVTGQEKRVLSVSRQLLSLKVSAVYSQKVA